MGLFEKKKSAISVFEGYVDAHCHILPGVDDGVQSLESSLRILDRYEKAGAKGVCFTPHVMEDVPNTPEELRERFENLKANYTGSLKLSLASENMMDELFEKRLSEKRFLPIGGVRLLVETSYYNPPINMDELLYGVSSAGYFPILAHPERYVYMDEKDYSRLKERGIAFQLNLSSLIGCYGKVAQAKAERMLSKGMYDYLGTDLHRESLLDIIEKRTLGKKQFALLEPLVRNNSELSEN